MCATRRLTRHAARFLRAAQTVPRRVLRVHEQKRSPNLKELPGTPLRRFTPRSELHLYCGEALTALRGWRPISAALPNPIPSFFVPGAGRLPFHHHRPEGQQDNRESIGKRTILVNSISLWKSACKPFRPRNIPRAVSGQFDLVSTPRQDTVSPNEPVRSNRRQTGKADRKDYLSSYNTYTYMVINMVLELTSRKLRCLETPQP